MDLRKFLPERSLEDIISERVRVTVGETEYVLPVKVVEDNEIWLQSLNSDFRQLMQALTEAGEDVEKIVALLTRDPNWLIDHLLSYDHTGQLPDRETIRKSMTPIRLLMAVGEVWRAANPLADIALTALTFEGLWSMTAPVDSPPTATSHRSTNGRRARSGRR